MNVHHQDMGGWMRVFADRQEDLPDDLAVYLSQAVSDWFRQRPQMHLRTVAPIQVNGDTVELHVWYDAHVLPAIQGPKLAGPPKG